MENIIIAKCEALLEIEAKEVSGQGKKLPTFKMIAYAGNAIKQSNISDLPIIVDTETVVIANHSLPILKDHKTEIAHTTKIFVENGQILAEGIFSVENEESKNLVATAKNGFPWQASIQGPFTKSDVEAIKAGEKQVVNGKEFEGPALIIRNLKLKEISILAMGADDETQVKVAAKATQIKQVSKEETIMAEEEKKEIKPDIKAEVSKTKETEVKAVKDEVKANDFELEIKAQNDALAKNARHHIELKKVCGENLEIYASALENSWSLDKAELETIKASRVNSFNIISGHQEESRSLKSLEIAACMSMGVKDETLLASYTDKEVEIASKRRGIGLKEIFESVCLAEGKNIPQTFGNETIRAAFTTLALPGIFSNALNKQLLQQYAAFPNASLEVSMQSDVQDFKINDRFRLVGAGDLLEVGQDGELKSGTLDEDKFTNQIDTFGRIIWLTRKDIINDDIGAFSQLPRMMGRKGAQKRETLFWDVVKNGETSGFFASGNSNLKVTTASALSITSLSVAEAAMAEQQDKNGNPVSILPAKLVVPPALRSTAESLMTATSVNDGTTSSTPNNNPHTGKFRIVVTPFLAASATPAGSDTAWYLMADGEDVAAYDTAFLRGQRAPTVETGTASFDKLGISWRVFFDLGVAEQDFRAAVKSTGVA